MDEKSGLNRRQFMGALGAAAATGALLQRSEGAGAPALYQDSFGHVGPAAADAIAAGVHPPAPQHPSHSAAAGCGGNCAAGTTCRTATWPQYNILLIMVDQLRSPRWLSAAQQSVVNRSITPNIYNLSQMSFIFDNYFVAATSCSPSRATFLSGLYAQQTGMFVTQDPPVFGPVSPALQPYTQTPVQGFPSIGDVLAQSPLLGYKTTWIGKWHLSDNPLESGTRNPGRNGPSDYGFNNADYCIPGPNSSQKYPYTGPGGYVSPNGMSNQGVSGEFLGGKYVDSHGATQLDVPEGYPASSFSMSSPAGYLQLNDAAIADAFNTWLPAAPAASPWFTAVSFVNPHDISEFPYSYGLVGAPGSCTDFCPPSGYSPNNSGYQPPPVNTTASKSYAGYYASETTIVPKFDDLYKSIPSGWNYPDNPRSQTYGAAGGKPSLQAYFVSQSGQRFGQITGAQGWTMFLNYYFWMQACVDAQVGRVLTALQASAFWNNTVIIFTSDHGDYGGSHSMHGKGGGLYDECISVPLYISLPKTGGGRQTKPIRRSFVCSSVDMLPFLYTLALGNESWRCNSNDLIYHLKYRESIFDAIFMNPATNPPQQRRLSCILNKTPIDPLGKGPPYEDWQLYQPYIIHTCDEFTLNYPPNTPNHAIAFRTVDVSLPQQTLPDGHILYGGGKLGMYTFWANAAACSATDSITWPDITQAIQFEFYDYTNGNNYGETGNQAFDSSGNWTQGADSYLCSYNTIACNELYDTDFQGSAGLQGAYGLAYQAFMSYLGLTCTTPGHNACPSAIPRPASSYTCASGCPPATPR